MKTLITTFILILCTSTFAQYDSLSRLSYSWSSRDQLIQYHSQSVRWIPLYEPDSSTYVIDSISVGKYDASPLTFYMIGGVVKSVDPIELGMYKTLVLEGYLQKFTDRYMDQNVKFVKEAFRGIKELSTSEIIQVKTGEVWYCYDVALDPDVFYQPFIYLKNNKGDRIRLVDTYWKGEHSVKLVDLLTD